MNLAASFQALVGLTAVDLHRQPWHGEAGIRIEPAARYFQALFSFRSGKLQNRLGESVFSSFYS